MPDDLPIDDRLVVPGHYLTFSFTRSGGSGGQHVNTSDTVVILRFALANCHVLHASVKRRIAEARPSAITQDGEFIIRADRHRSQLQNIEEARQRLVDTIKAHLKPPKRRRPTRPTRASKKRRLDAKKRRGSVKATRGKVRRED